jgi:hypothetical protein
MYNPLEQEKQHNPDKNVVNTATSYLGKYFQDWWHNNIETKRKKNSVLKII